MSTGKPTLGYNRPRSSAKFCQYECHSENEIQFYQITDEVGSKQS